MSYRLEIALNLKHRGDALMLKNEIIKLAEESRCELYYQDYEFQGKKRQFLRNHLFFIFFFPEDPKYIINFLYLLKKRKYVYIESIGFDNCKFTLLYASKKYLNMMDKYKAKEYLSSRKNIINEDFVKVIEAVH
jgi:hypothetical protein